MGRTRAAIRQLVLVVRGLGMVAITQVRETGISRIMVFRVTSSMARMRRSMVVPLRESRDEIDRRGVYSMLMLERRPCSLVM